MHIVVIFHPHVGAPPIIRSLPKLTQMLTSATLSIVPNLVWIGEGVFVGQGAKVRYFPSTDAITCMHGSAMQSVKNDYCP